MGCGLSELETHNPGEIINIQTAGTAGGRGGGGGGTHYNSTIFFRYKVTRTDAALAVV